MLTKPTAQVWCNFCSPMLLALCIFLPMLLLLFLPLPLNVFWCHCHYVLFHHTWLTNASAFNVAWVMEQDVLELSLATSCELFSFFLLDAICLFSSVLHVFICARILHEIPGCGCFKVDAALVRKNCIYFNIVWLILQSFPPVPPAPAPPLNFNSSRFAWMCSQLCVVLQQINVRSKCSWQWLCSVRLLFWTSSFALDIF